MAILQVGGAVAGGLALVALIIWSLDTPVPPCPPIATLPLRQEPDRPIRVPETQAVWREIEQGLYGIGLLTKDLTFTPRADAEPFRWDGVLWTGPRVWTLEEQERGLRPGSNATSLPTSK